MKTTSMLLLCVTALLLSSRSFAQIPPAFPWFDGGSGTLEVPFMSFNSRIYYVRMTLADPIALTFQLDQSALRDITPDGRTDGVAATDLIGSWSSEEGDSFTFNADGTFTMSQAVGIDLEACPNGGDENGLFFYTPYTAVFRVFIQSDSNGECGLSEDLGKLLQIFIDGNSWSLYIGGEDTGFRASKVQ